VFTIYTERLSGSRFIFVSNVNNKIAIAFVDKVIILNIEHVFNNIFRRKNLKAYNRKKSTGFYFPKFAS